MLKAKDLEKANLLVQRGWKQKDNPYVWRWVNPKFPHAQHTLDHAYDIERGKK